MKNRIKMGIATALVLFMTACSSTNGSMNEATGQADLETDNESKNVLVMYFSGTGHTKSVADQIAEDTGADEYEVVPSDPYTDEDLDWTNENSRVVQEYENESLQDVAFESTEIDGWENYDTVFVGYPIQWQDASWIMKSFVKYLDFSGKTVIPFATSSSSGIGESGKHLAEIAGSGDWKDGQRFSANASEEEISDWLESLGC